MLRKNWKYTLVLALTLGLVITVEWLSPKPINWKPTLAREDKIPFGSYVLFDLLREVFPGQTVRINERTVFEALSDENAAGGNYLFLAEELNLGEEDTEALLAWIGRGNQVFIAAERIGGKLADTLRLETNYDFRVFDDHFRISFVSPRLDLGEGYTFTHISTPTHFTRFDTLRTTVLGVDSLKRANFIRTDWGKGTILLHTLPLAFTNYHLLYRNNAEYASKALSYLPRRPLIWDEHYQRASVRKHSSPLRFFVQNEALRWALYTTLVALLLFILFEARRRQRIIPIIEPVTNTTLEFTETIGRLYYQHQDHKNIAEKKITYLLEYIRSRFLLNTSQLNEPFCAALAEKTGVSAERIGRLFGLIGHIRRQTTIAEEELLELNRECDYFYRESGK